LRHFVAHLLAKPIYFGGCIADFARSAIAAGME
jgi:hypothetical protein